MKRRTTPILQISHDLTISDVDTVQFLFKQEKSEEAEARVCKTYPTEVTEADGVFSIPFTQEETCKFEVGKIFYCDPRVTFLNGQIPATEILELVCRPTLWSEKDVENES